MRRAFYLLAPGSWRDYLNILHIPYTAWHLSYVVLGAALVRNPDYGLLLWTALAFFLALGVGGHALDELRGRPLGTTIPAAVLWGLGILPVAGAAAIGLTVGLAATPVALSFVAVGVFLVFAYNLEWGPFHNDLVFAFAWGAFPLVTSFVAQAGRLSLACVIVALAAAAITYVQRILSTRVRYLRRKVISSSGSLMDADGSETVLTREWLARDHERVLELLSITMPIISIGLLLE